MKKLVKAQIHVDLAKLGADFGYTVDGSQRGSVEDETFSADGAIITIHGVGIHPGFAKGKIRKCGKNSGRYFGELTYWSFVARNDIW